MILQSSANTPYHTQVSNLPVTQERGNKMKITIFNGNPNPENIAFDSYIVKLGSLLKKNHTASVFTIRDLDIKPCAGCWGCWVKTPGKCVAQDDSHKICREAINSDLLLFASPLIMGFTSAVLKRAQDKMIPLVHPYITLVNDECHHIRRYDHYPKLSLLLERTDFDTDQDIQVVTDIYSRMAINMKTEFLSTLFTSVPVEVIAHEIDNL